MYAIVDMSIQNEFEIKYILLTLFMIIIIFYRLLWIYYHGLLINRKTNKLKIVLGFSKENKFERNISVVQSLDIELVNNIGMNFIINYKNGYSEKIYYAFYRISFVEQAQFKRLKKSFNEIKFKNKLILVI